MPSPPSHARTGTARGLLHFLTALSFLLLLGTCALWLYGAVPRPVDSYGYSRRAPELFIGRHVVSQPDRDEFDHRQVIVHSFPGWVQWSVRHEWWLKPGRRREDLGPGHARFRWGAGSLHETWEPPQWVRRGLGASIEGNDLRPRHGGNAGERTLSVATPHWCLALLCAALPAGRAWRIWRQRTRDRRGLCRSCGYDLTANVSGVCPECGSPAADPPRAAGIPQ